MKLSQKGALDLMLVAAVAFAVIVGGFILVQINENKDANTEFDTAVDVQASEDETSTESDENNDAHTTYMEIIELGVKIQLTDSDKYSYKIDESSTQVLNETVFATVTPSVRDEYLVDTTCNLGLSLYVTEIEPEFTNVQLDGLYYFVTGSPYQCGNDADDALIGTFISEFAPENISEL